MNAPRADSPACRLESRLADREARGGRAALAAFVTAGYPEPARFPEIVRSAATVAEVVEIGVPFSDPMADGVTIQRASRVALERGVSLRWILDVLAGLAPRPAAELVLMSYLNPLLALGFDRVPEAAARAGVAGVIVPDLPLEESAPLRDALDTRGIALVPLVTPVTPPERLARIGAAARGFVYAVAVLGTTGGSADAGDGLGAYLDRVRAVSRVPVLAGFGVRTPAQARAVGAHADGVIVGSALIEAIEAGIDPAVFLGGLVQAGRRGAA